MKITVFTLAPTLKQNDSYASYAPYVKEMDIWFSLVDKVTIVSPTLYSKKILTGSFARKDIEVKSIPWIEFSSIKNILKTSVSIPSILRTMYIEMQKADHIHLRCPGTIGLLACLVQILFPKKQKTAKYAGNWDPKAKQPLSYSIQKWILKNTFLTKNMNVLVYGAWPKQSKNITSFFTASYYSDEQPSQKRRTFTKPFSFLFVGSLVSGKRPLYAIQLLERLIEHKILCSLKIYGDGVDREMLEEYVTSKKLTKHISFLGNRTAAEVKLAYLENDFLLLPSKSEGWPKVVAEAMYWGAIPFVTKISCVPWMLANGERGVLLDLDLQKDVQSILDVLQNTSVLEKLSYNAQAWSKQYTLDTFKSEINKFL